MDQVDFGDFSIVDIPGLVEKCCEATDQAVQFMFSDEVPIHASEYDRDFNVVRIGVGNAGSFSFTSLIAVILHELGHAFSCNSPLAYAMDGRADIEEVELIADVLAGAAFATFKEHGYSVHEAVDYACSIEIANNTIIESDPFTPPTQTGMQTGMQTRLNPRRISGVIGTGNLVRVEPDGAVIELDSISILDGQEDPSQTCTTVLERSLDFSAVVSAASNWRTFGDLPGSFGHGDASARYQAFTLGYDLNSSGKKPLLDVMASACKQYGIRL